jgi:hypothetical protein
VGSLALPHIRDDKHETRRIFASVIAKIWSLRFQVTRKFASFTWKLDYRRKLRRDQGTNHEVIGLPTASEAL